MTQHYVRKKAKKYRRHSSPPPSLASRCQWLLSGFAIGAAVSATVIIFKPYQLFNWIDLESAKQLDEHHQNTQPTTDKKAVTPTFDFYSLLPEMQVIVPEEADSHSASSQEAARNQNTIENYILQLAAFKTFSEADQFKAQLALLGFVVDIQNYLSPKGDNWHRIRSKQFNSLQDAQSFQNQLQAQNIDSLLIKQLG